jgi:hypothetical protein
MGFQCEASAELGAGMCNFKVLFVVLFVLGVTVILAQDVSFRIDPSTDFSKYKTYKWVHTDHSVYPVDV